MSYMALFALTMLAAGGAGCTEEAAGAVPRGRESRAVPGSRGVRTAAVGLLSLGGGMECSVVLDKSM